jgi:VIT1/CCC1 family predicted Fe2+/Mn2+ transporter
MENPMLVGILVDDGAVAAEPAQQQPAFRAWEDWLGKFFRGAPNHVGADADSVAAAPQQHARWILLCLLIFGFVVSLGAMYSVSPIFLAVSYIDSFEPKPIVVLLVLLVTGLAVALCVLVSVFFCMLCGAGICDYCLRPTAQYHVTDNLLQI